MNISERMARNDPLDQIEIGEIIDKALRGSFGEILKQIIEGMKAQYLSESEAKLTISADRTLGRIEGLNKLQNKLNYMVNEKNQLREEVREEKVVK